jgi:hypothetical protein
MLATLVVVGQALLVPLALHGLAFGISEAVAWHAHRVLPLWWCPIFGVPELLMLATLVKVEYALRVPLALHGPALLHISEAVAWHALRVLPLRWCLDFWLFLGLPMLATLVKVGHALRVPLELHGPTLSYFHITILQRHISKTVNNGSFSKHGVSWHSTLNGLWGYWAITLQCLLTVQLMSSVAQQRRFDWFSIFHPLDDELWCNQDTV